MRERSRSRNGGSRESGSKSCEEVSVETSHTVEFANVSPSRDDSQDEGSQNEDDEDRLERYRQSTLSEVSVPDCWMSFHRHDEDDEAEHDYEVEVEGEPPEFYRGRALFSGFNHEPEGEPHGPRPALPLEADEHGPLGPLDRVPGNPRNPRNPVTYPPLTWDEIDGCGPESIL